MQIHWVHSSTVGDPPDIVRSQNETRAIEHEGIRHAGRIRFF